ncbi:MAG: lycopene cyclase family protein [Candidatus Woesearchaeota archaeon]
MEKKTDYDIVIAGAGPAGLSLAAELSKSFKILIFDKNKIPFTTCTWYSYNDRINKHKLEEAVINKCSSLLYVASKFKHVMKDNCIILNEKKVLRIWLNKALNNSAEIRQLTLKSFSRNMGLITVITDKERVKAKLLIDCTGISSPILRKYELVAHINSWICFGYTIENIDIKTTDQIQFLPVNDRNNTYIGLYPHSRNKADFYVFRNLEGKLGSIKSLNSVFEKTLRKYFPEAKKTNVIQGKIISGELNQYALDNVVFFGESGMLTPPACGMGFNEILMQHRKFSKGIKRLMRSKRLDKDSLSILSLSLRNDETINFQRIMAKFTYYFISSPGKWEGGVKWLNSLGHLSKHWMRNDINLDWIKKATINLHNTIPLVETARYMPPKDFLFISEQFIRFVNKSLISEAEYLIKKNAERGFLIKKNAEEYFFRFRKEKI